MLKNGHNFYVLFLSKMKTFSASFWLNFLKIDFDTVCPLQMSEDQNHGLIHCDVFYVYIHITPMFIVIFDYTYVYCDSHESSFFNSSLKPNTER